MRPSAVISALTLLVNKKRPAFIWGPPGVGKSDIVTSVAHSLGMDLRDIRLNLLDAVDLKGFPTTNKAKSQMTWLPPDFLPHDVDSRGILFLDEMNSAAPSVQAAAYQLILNRRIGDYHLPDGWAVLAAGNREGDRSVVNRMPAALANRFVHIDFDVNTDDWADWALQNGVHSDLLAFIRFRADLLHKFDPSQKAFPSPRSWMFVNDLLHSSLDTNVEFELFKGTVGEGAAAEFTAFLGLIRDLPTIDEILLNPEGVKVPAEPSTRYALVTSLGMKAEKNNFAKLMKFINRVPTEFQVTFMRDTVKRDSGVAGLKEFQDWAMKNSNVLV